MYMTTCVCIYVQSMMRERERVLLTDAASLMAKSLISLTSLSFMSFSNSF